MFDAVKKAFMKYKVILADKKRMKSEEEAVAFANLCEAHDELKAETDLMVKERKDLFGK